MPDLNSITEALCDSLFVEVEASGRHVHLSKADAQTLFGHDLTEKRPLSQPGQYVAEERVTLVGPKGQLDRVAVLGPCRGSSQVEISKTDAVGLGIDAPVRLSGDISRTPGLTIRTDRGQICLSEGVIVAQRHIHMTPQSAARHGLQNGQTTSVKCLSERPIILEDVAVRVSDQFATYVHIDFDEANACGHRKGDLGLIIHG